MAKMAFDPNLTARPESQQAPPGMPAGAGESRPGQYGTVTNTGRGVPPRRHKLHRNNVEQEENEMMLQRRMSGEFYEYPKHMHKPGGLVREVMSEPDEQDALAKGWKADIREIEETEAAEAPSRVHHMTVKQALVFIGEHKQNAAKLVEIRADETTGGNRKAVLEALAEAEDAFGWPDMKAKPKAKGARKK